MAISSSLRPFPAIRPTIDHTAHSEVVSRTAISFHGKLIPLCIKAYLDSYGTFYSPHKPCMVFEIEREDEPGYDIGRFSIMRVWDRIDRRGQIQRSPYYEGDPLEEGEKLSHRRLYVAGMTDLLGEDQVSGEWPVLQVLAQLAVEILNREPESELVIDASERRNAFKADMLFAGGFAAKLTDGLLQAILRKNPQGSTSHFMTPQEDETEVPAFVTFSSLSTWEQVIQERPLLNYAPGPVMPIVAEKSSH